LSILKSIKIIQKKYKNFYRTKKEQEKYKIFLKKEIQRTYRIMYTVNILPFAKMNKWDK
jgi:hypothetical protein